MCYVNMYHKKSFDDKITNTISIFTEIFWDMQNKRAKFYTNLPLNCKIKIYHYLSSMWFWLNRLDLQSASNFGKCNEQHINWLS